MFHYSKHLNGEYILDCLKWTAGYHQETSSVLDFNDKPQIWKLPDVSLHKLAVVLRLLNERAFCTRLPNTPTTLLFLSATLNLNINLLPFCLLQCDLSVRSGPIIQSVFRRQDLLTAFVGLTLCVNLESKMDRQGSWPLSCSLKSVILWHKALIQTKCGAAVVFAARRLSRHHYHSSEQSHIQALINRSIFAPLLYLVQSEPCHLQHSWLRLLIHTVHPWS